FRCLRDMRETSGTAEAAIGQVVDRFERAVPLEIDGRAGVQHQAADAFLRKRAGGHTAGRAGADDDDIVIWFHVISLLSRFYFAGGTACATEQITCFAVVGQAVPPAAVVGLLWRESGFRAKPLVAAIGNSQSDALRPGAELKRIVGVGINRKP